MLWQQKWKEQFFTDSFHPSILPKKEHFWFLPERKKGWKFSLFKIFNEVWNLTSNLKKYIIVYKRSMFALFSSTAVTPFAGAQVLKNWQGQKIVYFCDHQYHMYSNWGTMNPRYPPETMRITWIPPYVCAQTCWDLPRKSRSDALYSISNKYCCHVVIFAWNHFAKLLMNYTVVYITQTRCVPGTARYALQGRLYKML